MKIKKQCPTHGYPPGWGNDRKYWGQAGSPTIEDGEIVFKVRYPYCGCEFETRTPMTGTPTKNGYIYVSTPQGWMSQHRFVWEVAYGKLRENMVVHHINGIRWDNNLENLIAIPKTKHNNNMPKPFEIECPHCNHHISIIKQRGKDPIIATQER